MSHSPSHNSGFTLTELIIVVAVAGILAALAVPSFTSLNQSQRVKNASMDLYSLFNLARSEAIKRNANITITPVMAGGQLDRIEVTSSGTVLYSRSAPRKIAINTEVEEIVYRRNGRITMAGTPTFQIDVEGTTTSTPTAHVRCITIGLSGVPNTRKGAC